MSNRFPRLAMGALLALACHTTCHAQIWQCLQDGRVVFSDKPCPQQGAQVDPRKLAPNVAQALPVPPARAEADPTPARGAPSRSLPANVCPDDQELRNMETSASSTTLGEPERAFLQDEVRRARQCRRGQGRYTEDDWRISRDAQAAQRSLKGSEAARLRAEGMHSAADPLEGERIEARRRDLDAALRQQALLRERQRLRPGGVPP